MASSFYTSGLVRAVAFGALLATSSAFAQNNADTVSALNRELLSHDSATVVLGQWCASHHLADPPVIRAQRDRDVDKPADRRVRTRLNVTSDAPVRYRHVRLTCGDHVLSEADNWYLPASLSPDMNRLLEQTDTPFGVVVRPLAFHRHTLKVTRLLRNGDGLPVPHAVLRHEAVLTDGAGRPFSYVVETYTSEVLAVSR